jgi:hypothetical protein
MSQDLRQLPNDSPIREFFEKNRPSFNSSFLDCLKPPMSEDEKERARQEFNVASAQPTTEQSAK